MANFDRYDKLEAVCKAHDSYPSNSLRSRSFQHSLDGYNDRLREESGDLFDSNPEYAGVKIYEAYDGSDFLPLQKYCTVEALNDHFKIERKDPRCRHIFITAPTSRSPLDCSKELFTFAFTFFQVMARFLDLVLTFGQQVEEKDFHYTAFSEESFLNSDEARLYAIPRLGRSGQDIRVCYNLWSVEKSSSPAWSIRQTAVYHSFDVHTGRSVWINVKGNELMQARITQAVNSCGPLQVAAMESDSGAFSAALHTHMLIMEWSGENWRSLISSLEKDIRSILDKAQSVPFRDVERALTVDPDALLEHLNVSETPHGKSYSRANSGFTNTHFSRAATADSSWSKFSPTKRIKSGLSKISTGFQTSGLPSPPMSPRTPESPLRITSPLPKTLSWSGALDMPGKESRFKVLEQFSIEEQQKLTNIGARLHEASLVMGLNVNILSEIVEYYESIGFSGEIPAEIRKNCAADLQYFCRRAKGIIRDQKMEQSRIGTLMRRLEDGKSLFDDILQFRNMEINKLFAVNAHQSGQRVERMTKEMHHSSIEMEAMTRSMKEVAEKTEKQTASMYIMTFFTLLFLPATFVATFFSSGIYQWDQNNAAGSTMPYWKSEYFVLFLEICVPLTGCIILLCWFFYFWADWRRRAARAVDDEENQVLQEKAK